MIHKPGMFAQHWFGNLVTRMHHNKPRQQVESGELCIIAWLFSCDVAGQPSRTVCSFSPRAALWHQTLAAMSPFHHHVLIHISPDCSGCPPFEPSPSIQAGCPEVAPKTGISGKQNECASIAAAAALVSNPGAASSPAWLLVSMGQACPATCAAIGGDVWCAAGSRCEFAAHALALTLEWHPATDGW